LAQQQSSFKSQSLSFKAYKIYVAAIFTHIVLKLYKNKYLRFSFKSYTADNRSYICSTPELPEKNFCDGLEMKRASPSGGLQQAGAPETAALSVTPCFFLRLLLTNG